MKMKHVIVPVIALLASFLLALASNAPASAAPSMWISGTPASGQFNNGLISPVGLGVKEASAKLYYLSSSSPNSRPKAGITLRGTGFDPNRSVGFGVVGKQGEPTEPWGTGTVSNPPPVTTDANGEFEYSVAFSRSAPSSYNKFDADGGEKLIIYPKYPDAASDANPDGRIDGAQVTLTVNPTVIVLPRALNPITMYAGTAYSFSGEDNGVACMIIDDSSREVKLAVAGMSLHGPGNADLPRENGAWQLPNGVTASANTDSSYIVLRTPESGVADELNQTFSIFGTGVSVVNDGFASVIGFPKTESTIATFNLQVRKSDRRAEPERDSFTFTNNKAAGASVTFKATPPNLAIKDLLIVDPATGNRSSSIETLGGLVMTADPARPAVTFSGTPHIDGGTGEGSYEVVWMTTDGAELSSTINVDVSTGDVYTPAYDRTLIGDGYPEYWQKGVAVTPTAKAILARSGTLEAPVKLTVEGSDGLEGLDIAVNSDNKGIILSGTPNFSGERVFYVNVELDPAGGVSGTISPNRVPFTVFVDDAAYRLSLDREKLEVPVGKELSANVNLLVEPKYGRDMIPRAFTITGDGVTRDEDGRWHWNGLSITDWQNAATWNSWLEFSGKAERDGSVELTFAPTRGKSNMSSAKLTVVALKDEDVADAPSETVVANHDDPIVIASSDVRYENAVAGETTKIIYVISGDTGANSGGVTVNNYVDIHAVNLVLPDGSTIQLSNLNDNTAANPFDGTANSYYFDRASGQITLYVTPETVGDYLCNVYYRGATAFYVRPVTLNVKRTTNYYYTDDNSGSNGGGGGCDAGAAAWFAA
ncbi:MAG: hypothetical protein LBL73_05285, partial [Synergistaceae bacterium]|nr:hypothetical protein [Synergistaceae bacterium]